MGQNAWPQATERQAADNAKPDTVADVKRHIGESEEAFCTKYYWNQTQLAGMGGNSASIRILSHSPF